MERKVTVYNNKTKKRYSFNSVANTLADLKADFDLHGIDYSGLDFTEGISNTQLLDDNSLLPSILSYKGKVTNDLVILLINTKKKDSLSAYTRKEAYAICTVDCFLPYFKKKAKNRTAVREDNRKQTADDRFTRLVGLLKQKHILLDDEVDSLLH